MPTITGLANSRAASHEMLQDYETCRVLACVGTCDSEVLSFLCRLSPVRFDFSTLRLAAAWSYLERDICPKYQCCGEPHTICRQAERNTPMP